MRRSILTTAIIGCTAVAAIAQSQPEKERREVESRLANTTESKSREVAELYKRFRKKQRELGKWLEPLHPDGPGRPGKPIGSVLARIGSGSRVLVSVGSRYGARADLRLAVLDPTTRRAIGWLRVVEPSAQFSLCEIIREFDRTHPIDTGAWIEHPLLDGTGKLQQPIHVDRAVEGRLTMPACRRTSGLTFTEHYGEAALRIAPGDSCGHGAFAITPATFADFVDLGDYGPSTQIAAPAIDGRIVKSTRDAYVISRGRYHGVERGLRLRVVRDGQTIAIVRVAECRENPTKATVEVVPAFSPVTPTRGDTVTTRPEPGIDEWVWPVRGAKAKRTDHTVGAILARVGVASRVYIDLGRQQHVRAGWRLRVRDGRGGSIGWLRVAEVKPNFSLCTITHEAPDVLIGSHNRIETLRLDPAGQLRLPVWVDPAVRGRFADRECRRASGLTFTERRDEARIVIAPQPPKTAMDDPLTVTPATMADYVDLPDYGPSTPLGAPALDGRIVGRAKRTFRISIGSTGGVERGLRLHVRRKGRQIAIVRVTECDLNTATVATVPGLAPEYPAVGDTVTTRRRREL